MDYEWDGEVANFADSVASWVKTYLCPRYKFLKDGWMNYSNKPESLLSLVRKKIQLAEGADYRESWERVICYVTIRCNLNNDIHKAYKGKS